MTYSKNNFGHTIKTERPVGGAIAALLVLLAGLHCLTTFAAPPSAPAPPTPTGMVVPGGSEGRSLTNAFNSALKLFEDGVDFYPEAENRFESFAATYTNSPMAPTAVLYQARARLGQSNYVGALDLLRAKMPSSGALTDQYYYWMAETLLAQGNYQLAAETYSNLNVTCPQSTIRLAAALGEARAFSKLSAWPKVIDLLGKTDGTFQTALKLETPRQEQKSDVTTRGYILLSQGLFTQGQYGDAERLLQSIDATGLPPELDWQRHYWLCRVQLASNRLADALRTCTNSLTSLAAGRSRDTADTISLRGEILEKLDRLQEATEAYTNNLAPGLAVDIRRHALFKAVALMLKQNQTQEASRRLETFIENENNDPALDVARLTLGELELKSCDTLLKSYYNPADWGTNLVSATNLLCQAFTNFNRLLFDFHDSPLRGKAYLDRGWCHWAQGEIAATRGDSAQARTEIALAKADFTDAISWLPLDDQVVARFKLADTQFRQHAYAAAVTNYNLVIQESEKVPVLRKSIFLKALYQLLRASVENNDPVTSDAAVSKIVEGYRSNFNDESFLLYGEFQSQKERSVQARQIFTDMIRKFPASQVRAETDYAIARSYAQEGDWLTAADQYDRWVTNHPQHSLLPQAEFSRALAHDKAGQEIVALTLFTNFVVRFPTSALAPWAQNWAGDYYFNHGLFDTAEKSYLDLSLKFPNAMDLVYHSRLMAGRAAFARLSPKDIKEARDHFTMLVKDLVKDTNAPPPLLQTLLPQTYFALGDTIFQQYRESTNSTNSNEIFQEAVSAFTLVTTAAPTNALAPLAKGRIGDCYFEWAGRPDADPSVYTNAVQFYKAVLDYPQAGITARSSAQVKLGLTAERMGQPHEALTNYLKVIYEIDTEDFDPVWVKEAAVNATQLCEKQERWDKAVAIYRRVLTIIPSLKPVLDKKIAVATAHLESGAK